MRQLNVYAFVVAGWCLSIIGLIQIPLWILYGVCTQRGESLKEVSSFETNNTFLLLTIFMNIENQGSIFTTQQLGSNGR